MLDSDDLGTGGEENDESPLPEFLSGDNKTMVALEQLGVRSASGASGPSPHSNDVTTVTLRGLRSPWERGSPSACALAARMYCLSS